MIEIKIEVLMNQRITVGDNLYYVGNDLRFGRPCTVTAVHDDEIQIKIHPITRRQKETKHKTKRLFLVPEIKRGTMTLNELNALSTEIPHTMSSLSDTAGVNRLLPKQLQYGYFASLPMASIQKVLDVFGVGLNQFLLYEEVDIYDLIKPITELCEQKNIQSLTQLEKTTGLNRMLLGRIDKGIASVIKYKDLITLCDYFNVPPSVILSAVVRRIRMELDDD